MRINLKTSAAGPDGSYGPGPCEVPDVFGKALIAAGYADAMDDGEASSSEPLETAVLAPLEETADDAPRTRSHSAHAHGKPPAKSGRR